MGFLLGGGCMAGGQYWALESSSDTPDRDGLFYGARVRLGAAAVPSAPPAISARRSHWQSWAAEKELELG